jgi:NTP pyrophosphatase (non-canonical NTP hydrolase)
MNLNEYRDACHKTAKEKGFWDASQNIAEKLMLIVTEVAEACEADRHGNKENFDEEIADTFIRLFDLCGYLNIDIEKELIVKMKFNEGRPRLHGKKY